MLLSGSGDVLALAAAVLIPAAVTGLVLLVRRPQRGVLLLVALAPFDGLLLLVPSPGLLAGWKEGLALLVLLATLVCPPAARGAAGRRAPIWFSLVAVWLLLSVAVTLGLGGGVGEAYAFKIGFFYLVVLAALWRCPFDRRERDLLLTVLLVDAVVVALYGVVQQFMGGAALNALGYEYNETIRTAGGQLRSFSSFNQPFAFAFFLMVVLLLLLPPALDDPRRLRHVVYFAVTPLLLLGVVSAIVRAALLGIAVGVALVAVKRYRGLALTVPPLLVGLAFVPPGALAPLLSPSSLRERVAGWAVSLADLPQHPLGQGLGTVGAAAQREAEAADAATGPAVDVSVYQPDNYYFKTALEIGILGAWVFLLFLLTVLSATTRTATELTGPDAALSLGISATIVAAAAASLVATYLEIFPLDLVFWVLLGVAASLDPRSRPPDRPAAGLRRRPGRRSPARQEVTSSA